MVSVGTMRTPARRVGGASGSRNRALQDRFLLHNQSPGASEVQLARGNQRLGARQLKRSEGSDLDLALVILIELLRRRQCLLLYLDVFVQTDQVVIKAAHAEDQIAELLAKYQPRNLEVVLRDEDVAAIDIHAKAAEQRLH